MGRCRRSARWICLLALCFFLLGCSGYKRYKVEDLPSWPPDPESGEGPLFVGKKIKVQAGDGTVVSGKLEAMDDFGLQVDGRPVPYGQVSAVQFKSFLWVPTVVLFGAGAGLYYVLNTSAGTFAPVH